MSQYLEMSGKEGAERGVGRPPSPPAPHGVARAGGLLASDGQGAQPVRASAIKQRVGLACFGLVLLAATAVCVVVYVDPTQGDRQCMQQVRPRAERTVAIVRPLPPPQLATSG